MGVRRAWRGAPGCRPVVMLKRTALGFIDLCPCLRQIVSVRVHRFVQLDLLAATMLLVAFSRLMAASG